MGLQRVRHDWVDNTLSLFLTFLIKIAVFLSFLWTSTAAATAKSLQSYPTLCDPIDVSPPGSPAPGFLQARTLEWVAISFSNACKWKVKVKSLSLVWLPATPWTAAYQAPPPMGFSRQEYWSWCHRLLELANLRIPQGEKLIFLCMLILAWLKICDILYFYQQF